MAEMEILIITAGLTKLDALGSLGLNMPDLMLRPALCSASNLLGAVMDLDLQHNTVVAVHYSASYIPILISIRSGIYRFNVVDTVSQLKTITIWLLSPDPPHLVIRTAPSSSTTRVNDSSLDHLTGIWPRFRTEFNSTNISD